jgi:hypothetical protein
VKRAAFALVALAALALACGVKAPPSPPLREAAAGADADAGPGGRPTEPASPTTAGGGPLPDAGEGLHPGPSKDAGTP